jgi:xanthine dehydrogenase accessory factor
MTVNLNPALDMTPASQRPERLNALLQHEAGVLVRVAAAQGSVPRGPGTWMAVFSQTLVGTIGGGHLEHQAIALARAHLQQPSTPLPGQTAPLRMALGPTLGQCCGGVVFLSFQAVQAADITALHRELFEVPRAHLAPVALFGGGHVGGALVNVLAGVLTHLPFAVRWIDSRDDVFAPVPERMPPGMVCEQSEPVQAAVPLLASQSRVLIMSFSHAEDLEVLAACLLRQRTRGDLPYIGLIGSQTKWATFRHRLEARGFTAAELAHVTCPIGVPGIHGKEPEVIAVAVAAQLLQTLAAS